MFSERYDHDAWEYRMEKRARLEALEGEKDYDADVDATTEDRLFGDM